MVAASVAGRGETVVECHEPFGSLTRIQVVMGVTQAAALRAQKKRSLRLRLGGLLARPRKARPSTHPYLTMDSTSAGLRRLTVPQNLSTEVSPGVPAATKVKSAGQSAA